jgi:hypothetical protein
MPSQIHRLSDGPHLNEVVPLVEEFLRAVIICGSAD